MRDCRSVVAERRSCVDRRSGGLTTLLCSFYRGRRKGPQRTDELCRPFYTDVYGANLLIVVLIIVSLCAADAGLTILILEKGGQEINPLMIWLLESGSRVFFAAKYVLTSVCLFFALMHVNYRLFNRFSVHHILVLIMGFYTALIVYEVTLLAV